MVRISSQLTALAQDGGGVIDAELAVEWALRVEQAELALLSLSREVLDTLAMVKAVPDLSALANVSFLKRATGLLSSVVPQFIYGISAQTLIEVAAPLADFRKTEDES